MFSDRLLSLSAILIGASFSIETRANELGPLELLGVVVTDTRMVKPELDTQLLAETIAAWSIYPAPKINASYDFDSVVNSTTSLRFGCGKDYRAQNLKELSYVFDHSTQGHEVLGNLNLEPESANIFLSTS